MPCADGTLFIGCYIGYVFDVKIDGALMAIAGNTPWEHFVQGAFTNMLHFMTHTFGFGCIARATVLSRAVPCSWRTLLQSASEQRAPPHTSCPPSR